MNKYLKRFLFIELHLVCNLTKYSYLWIWNNFIWLKVLTILLPPPVSRADFSCQSHPSSREEFINNHQLSKKKIRLFHIKVVVFIIKCTDCFISKIWLLIKNMISVRKLWMLPSSKALSLTPPIPTRAPRQQYKPQIKQES